MITKLEMPSMKKVVRLNLAHNRYLKSVSGFSQLPALRELDIRHTQLVNLDEIGKCTLLRKLNAGGLKLEDSYFLTSLSALSELNLSGCRISEFPNLKKLRNLKSLDLSGARLPWAAGGVLVCEGPSQANCMQWGLRLENILKQCVQNGASILFTITYGLRCVYNRVSAPLTLYHFFIRIGFDEVMERKLERRLQTPNNEYKVVLLGFRWAGDPPFHAPAVSFKAYALCGHFEYAK